MSTLCRYLPFLLIVCLAQACETQSRKQSRQAPELDQARALTGPGWPAGPAERLTTAGDVYLGNLGGQIRVLEQHYKRAPNDIVLVRLARSLYHYYQITARLPYADRAHSLLSTVYAQSQDPEVGLVYAEVLSGFHRFREALQVLDAVELHAADAGSIAVLRSSVKQSLGLSLSDDDMTTSTHADSPSSLVLVNLAADALERGNPDKASGFLRQAQTEYTGVSPYVLSWIHVQQGIVFLRWRDYESARLFFAAAYERFPQFVLAAEHLAETELALGHHERAVELYRPLAKSTENPEFYHRLSIGERAIGQLSAAATHSMLADEGYASLLLRYPGMFSDHAARYYLDTDDIAKALALAVDNLRLRQDIGARRLLVEVQLEAGDTGAACQEYEVITGLRFAPPELAHMADFCSGQQ